MPANVRVRWWCGPPGGGGGPSLGNHPPGGGGGPSSLGWGTTKGGEGRKKISITVPSGLGCRRKRTSQWSGRSATASGVAQHRAVTRSRSKTYYWQSGPLSETKAAPKRSQFFLIAHWVIHLELSVHIVHHIGSPSGLPHFLSVYSFSTHDHVSV